MRCALVAVAIGLAAVFGLAAWLNPYDTDGSPKRMETHRQLGLPPCAFHQYTGYPCPSCGMTTSFALLVRGDLRNSLRANGVGTLLALFWLGLIPWSLASAWKRRMYWVRNVEIALLWIVGVFLALLLGRWLVVIGWAYWHR